MNPSQGPRVLIIDDDRAFVNLVMTFLRGAGYAASGALDAMQGVAVAIRERPDLILVDLQMPAGGGFALVDRLKLNARTQGVPVIVITGTVAPEAEEMARSRGVAGFVRKPIVRETLLAAVEAVLGPAPATRAPGGTAGA